MGVFNFLRRTGSFSRDGSSRRGRRFQDGSTRSGQDDPSGKGDSSTHSALFDLELSHRSGGGRAGDLLARLNSSVHDEGGSTGAGADTSARMSTGLLQRVTYLGRPVMEFELDLLQDVRSLRSTCTTQPDGQLDLASMVRQLQHIGYACYLKSNNPADPGHRHNVQASCLEKLRHEYIMCAGRQDGSTTHWCLIDPRFREQFAIAHPTPAYDRLLKAVPLEFVGSQLRLQALVETLCSEMAEAFGVQQMTLPPWRKAKSMLSKWFDPEEMPGHQQHQHQQPGGLPGQRQQQPGPQQAPQGQQRQPAGAGGGGTRQSPFEQQHAEAAAAGGQQWDPAAVVAAVHLVRAGSGGGSGSGGAAKQSLLQQQAAAALAARQGTTGGSQDFYEALAMHQESMRLQQQAAAGGLPQSIQQQQQRRRGSPPGQSPGSSPHQQQQPQQQQPHQHSPGAQQDVSPTGSRQMQGASPAGKAQGQAGSMQQGLQERSNKPRRRASAARQQAQQQQQQQQHFFMPGGQLPPQAPPLWSGDGGGSVGDKSGHGLTGALAGLTVNLHVSGSWSDLSTIMETRSNASSPATLAAMAAGGGLMGTSAASRRSAGSLAAPRRSPATQPQAASPAGGSMDAGQLLPSSAAAATGSGAGVVPPPASQSGSSEQADGSVNGSTHAGRKKVVSLLAKGLKSVGQKQTWSSLLPSVSTVRRVGVNGVATTQRSWSWRPSGASDNESSRSGRGRPGAAAAALQ